jgi:hypothetical protein
MNTGIIQFPEAWSEGWRMALADAQTGAGTLICDGSQEALDKAAGYRAGREYAQGCQPDREAGS